MSFDHSLLGEEVFEGGVVPFYRFMDRALYCPEHGYYERRCHTPGRGGDYFTSVSVGEVFGGLLARRFCAWMDGSEAEWVIVEGGAHDGQLAADILGWVRRVRPDCLERMKYVILEPSVKRRGWQESKLGEWGGKVVWVDGWEELRVGGVCGVVISNELLDAMPVVRLGWDGGLGGWFEWGVTWDGGRFTWARMERVSDLPRLAEEWLGELERGLGEALPDGCVLELAPGAMEWWGAAASVLRSGYLVGFDYGWDGVEGWRLAGGRGTLRGYRGHQWVDDVLADPGGQDLTAHVHWDLIRRMGEGEGLRTEALRPQGRWLGGVMADCGMDSWGAREVRQFHTLTHPGQMGSSLQVLVQSRGR